MQCSLNNILNRSAESKNGYFLYFCKTCRDVSARRRVGRNRGCCHKAPNLPQRRNWRRKKAVGERLKAACIIGLIVCCEVEKIRPYGGRSNLNSKTNFCDLLFCWVCVPQFISYILIRGRHESDRTNNWVDYFSDRNHCNSANSGQMTMQVIVRKRVALCDLLIKINFS